MRNQEHHYEVYEIKDGFKVVPRESHRPVIFCKLNEYGFWNFFVKKQRRMYENIPLYHFYYISDTAVDLLYETWKPKKKACNPIKESFIVKYCHKTTGRTLNKKIHDIWEKKCNSLDPIVKEVHKKLYSVSRGTGYWERVMHVLRNREYYNFLINDILKYPSARIALLHGKETRERFISGWDFPPSDEDEDEEKLNTNWMEQYAYNEKVYTSLRKTLMNLPFGVTYYEIFNLQGVRLPEPATTRMRLWAYCMLGKNYRITDDRRDKFARTIQKSSDEKIKEAIRYIWKYFPTTKTDDFRKNEGIKHALGIIFDYPYEVGNWDMLGLAKRAEVYHHELLVKQEQENIEWNRRCEENQVRWAEQQRIAEEKYRKEHEAMMPIKTALPPIQLPKSTNITFLDTYGMIVEEGGKMGHCIATYAESAVNGKCYLFHVEHNGEMASVEVSPQGFVSQSYGPHDRENKASVYGKRTLAKWAKDLQNKSPILRAENIEEKYVSGIRYAIGAELGAGVPF